MKYRHENLGGSTTYGVQMIRGVPNLKHMMLEHLGHVTILGGYYTPLTVL